MLKEPDHSKAGSVTFEVEDCIASWKGSSGHNYQSVCLGKNYINFGLTYSYLNVFKGTILLIPKYATKDCEVIFA